MSEREADRPAEVVPLGRGRYLVDNGAERRVAFAVASRDTWVSIDGQVYVVPSPDASARRTSTSGDGAALAAPMPATVLAIRVTPGQSVARGDVLIVLEAMKMELAIQAPRDGQVKGIACKVGDLVQPGVTLLELSEERAEK